MIKKHSPLSITLLVFNIFTSPIFAQLDDIGKMPWLGNFALFQDRETQLVIHSTGGMKFSPVNKGEAHPYNKIPILYGVMIKNADGLQYLLKPIPESLTSEDEATTKFKRTTIKGKVQGGAEFEMTVKLSRGTLSIGGRLTSPGKLQPDTVQFGIATRVIDFYTYQKENTFKGDPEGFLELISDDALKFKRLDGKKQKHDYPDLITLETDTINGPGIKEAEVNLKILRRTFSFEASKNSSFALSNSPETPLYQGMLIKWTPTRGKNSKGDSHLSISIK